MNNFSEEFQNQIARSDPERLRGYIDTFDRYLLYTLAVGSMPPEVIDQIIEKWEETIKATIDAESKNRTHFLESTPQGRLAKRQNIPDGEAIRLFYLDTLNTAKNVVMQNMQRHDDELDIDDVDDDSDFIY